MPFAVEQAAHGLHAPVHHVAGRHRIGAGPRVVERHLGERLHRGVVVDRAAWQDVAAMTMIGRATQADIGPDQKIRTGVLDGRDGLRGQPLRVERRAGASVLLRRRRKEQYGGHACRGHGLGSFTSSSTDSWDTPGMLDTGCRTARPGTANSG